MGKKRPRPHSEPERRAPADGNFPPRGLTDEELRSPWELFTPAQRSFLACLAETYQARAAANAAGVSYWMVWAWRNRSAAFREAMARAKLMAADLIESEAVRRACEGVPRKRFFKGRPIIDPATGKQYVEQQYSDYLLSKLLDGTKPRKYRPRAEAAPSPTADAEAPQQGQGIASFLLQRAIAAEEARKEQAPRLGHDAGGNGDGNGNGKPHE